MDTRSFAVTLLVCTLVAGSGCGGPPRYAIPVAQSGAYATTASEDSLGAEGRESEEAVVVVPAVPSPTAAPVGLLTATTVGDADRRDNYLAYVSRHENERSMLRLGMNRRKRFKVVGLDGRPILGATISIDGELVGRTHADGVWDLFADLSSPQAGLQSRVHVQAGDVQADIMTDIAAHADSGDVIVRIPFDATGPAALDLQFAIDVTGSMEDELRYVNGEIAYIVQRVRAQSPQVRMRVGATFYRDRGDEDLVQTIAFTDDVNAFAVAMTQIDAHGGGDYPEDMNTGLSSALHDLQWSSEASAVRVLVLIADAPPQHYSDTDFDFHDAMRECAKRGIRILPVAASGADRTTEFLMRAMATFTSTPYAYLTDDSGIGAPHMHADTDRVAVEPFNQMLARLLLSELMGEGMHEPGPFGPASRQ